jgi:major vault protein
MSFSSVILGPERMITIPPNHYCVIENPVIRNKDGNVVFDKEGQAKLLFADHEIRFARSPFPLFPGEVLKMVKYFEFNFLF